MSERRISDKVYRHFLYKYLDVIYDYLKYGVLDRTDIYSDAFKNWKDPAWPGMNIRNSIKLYPNMLPDPGYVYSYEGKYYIAYSVNRYADDKGIIRWGYEMDGDRRGGVTPEGKSPLFFLIPLVESLDIPKITEGDKVYTYMFLREERIATYHSFQKKIDGELKTVKNNFRLDLTIDFPKVTKEEVAKSIAIFFSIVNHAGKEKENAGAPEDIEEAMKLVLGRQCSPFRFIPALGHQLMRYIVGAFDFKGGVPGNFDNKDNRLYLDDDKIPNASGSYNDMVQRLFGFANKCASKSKDLQTRERFRSAIEIIELIYFHKAFRNKESHSEYKINNPVLYTNYYLIDHIMLIYALVYLLKVTPKDWLSDDKLKYDVSLPTNEEENEFNNYEKTDYKDLITFCLQRLKDIESDALTEEKVENSIREAISENNRLTDDCIKKLESEVKDSTGYIKEHLSEIEGLKREQESIRREQGIIITQVEAHEKEIKKNKKRSIIAIIISCVDALVLLVLIFGLLGIPYINWAISYEPFYSYSKLLPWAPTDLSYDRAIYLENKLNDNLVDKDLESLLSESNTQENIELRNQIKNAYLDAIDEYENLNKSDERYGERYYKVAQMYLRGKGGIIDIDKALENAHIALRNGYTEAKGLRSYIWMAHKLTHDRTESEEWRHAVRSSTPPYSDVVFLIDKMARIQNSNEIPDKEEINSIEKGFEKLIGSRNSEVFGEAAFLYSQLCKNWLFNKKNMPLITRTYIVRLYTLFGLAIMDNYLPAQLESLSLAQETNNYEWYRIIANQIFQNGFTAIAINSYNYWVGTLNNTEKNFDHNFPGFRETINAESESFIDLYHLAIDSYKKGNYYSQKEMKDSASISYMDTLYYYRLAEKQSPPDVYYSMGDFAHWIKVRGSDSLAMEWKKKLMYSPRPDQRGTFRDRLDSISRFKAWEAYVTAYFMKNNFAGYKNNTDSVLNLIRFASKLGLDKATYSLGLSDFENNRIEECTEKMKSIAERNDDACIWLAERFRGINPDESIKYVRMIKDSLNLYKNIMIMRHKLDRKYALGLDETISHNDIRRLHQSFNFSDNKEECQKAAFFELASIIEGQLSDDNRVEECIQYVLNWAYLCISSNGSLYGFGYPMMRSVSEVYMRYLGKHPELGENKMNDNPILNEIMQVKYGYDMGLLHSKAAPALTKEIAGRDLYKLFPDSFNNLIKEKIFSEKDAERIKHFIENLNKSVSPAEMHKIQAYQTMWSFYEPRAFTNSYVSPLVSSYNFINIEP